MTFRISVLRDNNTVNRCALTGDDEGDHLLVLIRTVPLCHANDLHCKLSFAILEIVPCVYLCPYQWVRTGACHASSVFSACILAMWPEPCRMFHVHLPS